MGLKSDLEAEVSAIFKEQWTERDGRVVPTGDDIKLNNDAINIDATVLYADLSGSTAMVDKKTKHFSAEVYKTFLRTASRIIRTHKGTITAFDGDRVMAVYLGDGKESDAAKTALKINWACKNIIQPELKKVYTASDFVLKHVVGIDTSSLFVVNGGIRGSNDLVWVGRAANYAAKLSNLGPEASWITKAVYDKLDDNSKLSKDGDMWTRRKWTQMNDATIYSSTYWWEIS